MAFNVWIIHICITKVGMIYIEINVLRMGNEQLLNNLEEGVVIQEESTTEIKFLNTAAKHLLMGRQCTTDDTNVLLLDQS